uniref:Uncharacterized protein n=1 Tax=Cacopsylla melanoneura TaxID=428564 RepID=A0A8D9EYX4_9HEMI
MVASRNIFQSLLLILTTISCFHPTNSFHININVASDPSNNVEGNITSGHLQSSGTELTTTVKALLSRLVETLQRFLSPPTLTLIGDADDGSTKPSYAFDSSKPPNTFDFSEPSNTKINIVNLNLKKLVRRTYQTDQKHQPEKNKNSPQKENVQPIQPKDIDTGDFFG